MYHFILFLPPPPHYHPFLPLLSPTWPLGPLSSSNMLSVSPTPSFPQSQLIWIGVQHFLCTPTLTLPFCSRFLYSPCFWSIEIRILWRIYKEIDCLGPVDPDSKMHRGFSVHILMVNFRSFISLKMTFLMKSGYKRSWHVSSWDFNTARKKGVMQFRSCALMLQPILTNSLAIKSIFKKHAICRGVSPSELHSFLLNPPFTNNLNKRMSLFWTALKRSKSGFSFNIYTCLNW